MKQNRFIQILFCMIAKLRNAYGSFTRSLCLPTYFFVLIIIFKMIVLYFRIKQIHKKSDCFQKFYEYTFFFYKQVFYKQPQAQITKNISTMLSTLSASDFVSKETLLEKIVACRKKWRRKCQYYANLLINFTKIS